MGEATLSQQTPPLPTVQELDLQDLLQRGISLDHDLLRVGNLLVLAEDYHRQGGLHHVLQDLGGGVEPQFAHIPLPIVYCPHLQGDCSFV